MVQGRECRQSRCVIAMYYKGGGTTPEAFHVLILQTFLQTRSPPCSPVPLKSLGTRVGLRRVTTRDTMESCKDCKSGLAMDSRSGELACMECGLVQQEKMTVDECGHWDFFHEGTPLEGPSTKSLPALCQPGGRMERRASAEQNKTGKKLREDFAHVDRLVELLSLPSPVASTAHSYLTTCLSKRFQRGNARQGTIIACIFHACRTHGAPRTARELSTVSEVPSSSIKQACKRAHPFIAADRPKDLRPEDLLARCCKAIMNGKDHKVTTQLLLACKRRCVARERLTVLQGKTPSTVAAVIIWKVAQEQKLSVSRKEISIGCGVSVGTLVKAEIDYDGQAEEVKSPLTLDLNL